MKTETDYIVYFTDTDGSERKGGTFAAKSVGHARDLAGRQGIRRITDVVVASEVKTSAQFMIELRAERDAYERAR